MRAKGELQSNGRFRRFLGFESRFLFHIRKLVLDGYGVFAVIELCC